MGPATATHRYDPAMLSRPSLAARFLPTFSCAVALSTLALAQGKPDHKPPPVEVFVLLGQSNMVGFGSVDAKDQPGTLKAVVDQDRRWQHLRNDDGSWKKRDDVWCVKTTVGQRQGALEPGFGANPGCFGPELAFGYAVGDAIEAPVLLIKASQGNRSLGWDILPPGSERFDFEGRTYAGYKDDTPSWVEGEEKKPVNWYAGKQYDDFVKDIREVLADLKRFYPQYDDRGYRIAGFGWFQGHKDQNGAHASRYEQNLVHLIDSLRAEFETPQAPFVIASIGFQGQAMKGHGLTVLQAQLAVDGTAGKYPRFADSVRSIDTRPFWRGPEVSPNKKQDYHYHHNAATYLEVGDAMGRAMVALRELRPAGDAASDKPTKAK